MPRTARLDYPGTLHHVIFRGIERCLIVADISDRQEFINRMSLLAEATGTVIYAWALMTNHAHILLRSGKTGLPSYMRKLLSGYAQYFNRRHNRSGHLFQNRYKSIICEEETYFQKLVAYIHLNPLRAGLVPSLNELEQYPWCGHGVILKSVQHPWQNRNYVLESFGLKEEAGREAYKEFVTKEAGKGAQLELAGGGLVRSHGGWSVVQSKRKQGSRVLGDARILGSNNFVLSMLDKADEHILSQIPMVEIMQNVQEDIQQVCKRTGITVLQFRSGGRIKPLPALRKELASKFVNEYGLSLAESARQLGITTSAVYQLLKKAPLQ
ncbi:MAG: transposase [Chlorobiales bacterium]|nr:transposase [Chlorobiales bacterium]